MCFCDETCCVKMDSNQANPSKSIFPAYSNDFHNLSPNNISGCEQRDWLQNDSFTTKNVEALYCITKEEQVRFVRSSEDKEFNKVKPVKVKDNAESEVNRRDEHKFGNKDDDISDWHAGSHYQSSSSKHFFIKGKKFSSQGGYTVDLKPDRNNLSCNFMYAEHVAFYRCRQQSPLGLNKSYLKYWVKDGKQLKCKKDKRYYTKLPKACELNLSKSELTDMKSSLSDYMPLQVTNIPSAKLTDNKPITSKAKSEKYIALTLCDNSQNLSPDKYIYEKTSHFNRQLQENPKDEDLWFQFLAFQDEILSEELKNTNTNLSKSLNRMVVDKKLSIIDKALMAIPDSVRLAMAKLELCQDIWEIDSLLQQWEQLITCSPDDIELWKKYICFVKSHLTYFSVPYTVKLYTRSIEALTKEHPLPYCVEKKITDIFSQLCIFLYQCGYRERALAIFQAILEFSLCQPTSFCSSEFENLTALFEPFWDSGAPRFGEENSSGWGKTMEEKQWTVRKNSCDKRKELNNKEDEIIKKHLEKSSVWLRLETLRDEYHWLPWSPNPENDENEDSCEDTERMVLIDDVSGTLFLLTTVKAKFHLILQFLKFLGVHIHDIPCPSVEYDQCIGVAKDVIKMFNSSPSPSINGQAVDLVSLHSILPTSMERIPFINRVFKQSVNLFPLHFRKHLELIWLKFNVEHFKNENNSLTKEGYKIAKKLAKTLLKEEHNRNNLAMWKEYGFLEWIAGNKIEARNAFETILSTCIVGEKSSIQEQCNLWKLIRTFVELESGVYFCSFQCTTKIQIALDTTPRVLWILSCFGSGTKYVPYGSQNYLSMVLKARNNYQKILTKELLHLVDNDDVECICFDSNIHLFADCAMCYMYLLYFSQGIQAVKIAFENILENVEPKLVELPQLTRVYQVIEEMIYMSYIQILNFHTWKNSMSLTPLRCSLQTALKKYPTNVIFLQCLYALETGSLITGYFHRFYAKLLQTHSSAGPVLWLFAIFTELKRYNYICLISGTAFQSNPLLDYAVIPESTVVWKIRSLFERALNSLHGHHCSILWRLYIKFEMLLNEKSRAKAIFYRALQKNPWLKILYEDGVQHFSEDLQQILDLMTEKEIRINTPIEEVDLLLAHASDEEMQ